MKVRFPNFPNTHLDPFLATSPHTPVYNCIAWAFGDNTKWYWPDPLNTYYWPPGIPREINIQAFISLFELAGYIVCENGQLETGYEKIVIFADQNGNPKHAARQLSTGQWTSKLGQNIDVQHTINSMVNGDYGIDHTYMRRFNAEFK